MKVWKVILAALVIFSAGAVTGGLTVKLNSNARRPTNKNFSYPSTSPRSRSDLAERMQRELSLTPAQKQDLDRILRESKERTKKIWESAHEENRNLRENIRGLLTAEQRTRFEEVFKPRGLHRPGDGKAKEDARKLDERPATKPLDKPGPSTP